MTYDIDQLIQLYYNYCKAGPAYMQTPGYATEDRLWANLTGYSEDLVLGSCTPATDDDLFCGLNDDQIQFVLHFDDEN